jgi:hypothetical protein
MLEWVSLADPVDIAVHHLLFVEILNPLRGLVELLGCKARMISGGRGAQTSRMRSRGAS